MGNKGTTHLGLISALIILFGLAGMTTANGQVFINENASDDQSSSMEEEGSSNSNAGEYGPITFSGSEYRSESAGLSIVITPFEESDGVCEMEEGDWDIPEFCGWGESQADAAAAAMAAVNQTYGDGAAASGSWSFTISPDN